MAPKPKPRTDSAYSEPESHIGEPEKMVFPKEQLRAHRECVNHKPQGIGRRKRKRGEVGEIEVRRSTRHIKVDRISELPDSVLLHIMKFMDTKDAVRTCVLSKRWKDLCKRLTNLKFHCPYRWVKNFKKFASWVLSSRDDSCSLLNLVIKNCIHPRNIHSVVVDSIIKYALFHNVQKLKMNVVSGTGSTFESLPLISCCKSLTSLKLCFSGSPRPEITLPKSLHLPALKTLYLQGVNFSVRDNDCYYADPFSNCHLLTTLVLKYCSLHPWDLKISNSSLSNLTIYRPLKVQYSDIVLSTPNLSSCTFVNFSSYQLSSTCNLSLLEEVNIFDRFWQGTASIFIRWLQILANVKILTLNSYILRRILPELPNPSPMRPKPLCFVRLESVKVMMPPFSIGISSEEVRGVVEYLFDNFPMEGLHIIPSVYA